MRDDTRPTAAGTTGEPYNSNSFMRGLLDVCQIPLPPFFGIRYPGSQKPVPSEYFPIQ